MSIFEVWSQCRENWNNTVHFPLQVFSFWRSYNHSRPRKIHVFPLQGKHFCEFLGPDDLMQDEDLGEILALARKVGCRSMSSR